MGQTPGVCVKLRDDGQDHVALGDAKSVGGHGAQRVQERGAMGVDHALWIARGSAGVTHGCGPILVGHVEFHGICRGEEFLVVTDTRVVRNLTGTIIHHDEVLHRLELGDARPKQRQQAAINEDHLVLSMVHYINQLLRKEADVEGVQHSSSTRNREI